MPRGTPLEGARNNPENSMLGYLRTQTNSFLIKGIIVLISLSFILFFGSTALLSDRTQMVAEVDGYAIRDSDLNQEWRLAVRRAQRFNPNFSEADTQRLRSQVLDSLIERRLITEEARKEGFVVSRDQVQRAVLEEPGFQDDEGNFDMDRYKAYLGNNAARAASELQSDYQGRLLYSSIVDFIGDSVVVSEREVRDAYEKENSKRNVEFIKVSSSRFRSQVSLSEDELSAFVAEHADAIRERYERDFDRKFNSPKKVSARHILIKFEDSDDEAARADIRSHMDAILAEARADGGDFAALAAKHSEDSSASRGGDLGFFDKGRMVQEFSDAAFALEPGSISEIVETKYGLHIIKVEEVQEASTQALDEVRDEVALDLAQEKQAPELARAHASKMVAILDGSLDELEAATLLAEQGTTIQESGEFNGSSRSVPKLGGTTPRAVQAAFGLAEAGSVTSEPVEIPVGYVVMRLKDKTEPNEAEFEEQKTDLKNTLLRTRRTRTVEAWKADLKNAASIRVVPGV